LRSVHSKFTDHVRCVLCGNKLYGKTGKVVQALAVKLELD
jgi:ribosomal protein S27E